MAKCEHNNQTTSATTNEKKRNICHVAILCSLCVFFLSTPSPYPNEHIEWANYTRRNSPRLRNAKWTRVIAVNTVNVCICMCVWMLHTKGRDWMARCVCAATKIHTSKLSCAIKRDIRTKIARHLRLHSTTNQPHTQTHALFTSSRLNNYLCVYLYYSHSNIFTARRQLQCASTLCTTICLVNLHEFLRHASGDKVFGGSSAMDHTPD